MMQRYSRINIVQIVVPSCYNLVHNLEKAKQIVIKKAALIKGSLFLLFATLCYSAAASVACAG